MSILTNLNTQNSKANRFTNNELKVLWANEYMEESNTGTANHMDKMKEIRAQQEIGVNEKTITAKNVSTVAGVAIASAIILKEYGGVVASKALPMVSKYL